MWILLNFLFLRKKRNTIKGHTYVVTSSGRERGYCQYSMFYDDCVLRGRGGVLLSMSSQEFSKFEQIHDSLLEYSI